MRGGKIYLIMVYDINEKRVNKVLKIARKYLNWIQNSVLEGEISQASFTKLKFELREIIEPTEDSIVFYIMRNTKYTKREIMGIEKGGEETII